MVDRRQLIVRVGATIICSPAFGSASAKALSRERFVVHEPTEIAWIIASLSPLGRVGGGTIRRDTRYFAAVARWFSSAGNHPAVTALGTDFNLPRLVGNAADYRFDANGTLIRSRAAEPLWDDAEGDLFTRYRREIEDFSQRYRAIRFFDTQRPTLVAADAALHAAVDMRDITAWLQTQFTARPAPIEIFVSPLTDGWNWTNLGGPKPRIWVPAPKPGTLSDPVNRLGIVASVFTEVDHIYVNPVTKAHAPAVNLAFAKDRGWATDAAWSDYPSPELVFNEYMTWSVFLEYAQGRLGATDFQRLSSKIVRFMEDRRGFVTFGKFLANFQRARSRRTTSLQAAFPTIIASVS